MGNGLCGTSNPQQVSRGMPEPKPLKPIVTPSYSEKDGAMFEFKPQSSEVLKPTAPYDSFEKEYQAASAVSQPKRSPKRTPPKDKAFKSQPKKQKSVMDNNDKHFHRKCTIVLEYLKLELAIILPEIIEAKKVLEIKYNKDTTEHLKKLQKATKKLKTMISDCKNQVLTAQ